MKLYVVCSADGKFFRPKGYGGYGDNWQDDLAKAKFYSKIGPAQAQCTFWFKNYPKFGCPVILEFNLDPASAVVIPQAQRATEDISKINKEKEKYEEESRLRFSLQNEQKVRELIDTLTTEQKERLGIAK